MRNVNLELLNSLKIIRTSFHENNSRRPEVWQHYDRLERKCENHWLRIEFPSKNNQQITNLVLCRLRIFYIGANWFKSWYLEFWNFCKLILRVGRAYCGFLSFLTEQSGWISNFKTSSNLLQSLVKTCLEETSRAQTRCIRAPQIISNFTKPKEHFYTSKNQTESTTNIYFIKENYW